MLFHLFIDDYVRYVYSYDMEIINLAKNAFKIVIPARYASTRLAAKPLCMIAGKTMLQHTFERAGLSEAEDIYVATDDERIQSSVQEYSQQVIMTSPHHQSGTERLAEVVDELAWDDETIVVNVQGDEPLIRPDHINRVARALQDNPQAGIATLAYQIQSGEELFDPNVVKVVRDNQDFALYFSRAVIPWHRDKFSDGQFELPDDVEYYRHIGIYAYRAKILRQYCRLPSVPLERIESLEQLRALSHGIKIHVGITPEAPGHGVDVEKDLRIVEQILMAEQKQTNEE